MTLHTQGNFTLDGGMDIYWQAWQPEGEPRAVVALSHGLGEHSGRYGHVAAALNAGGYSLYALDLPGHGKSGGRRGHVSAYTGLLDALGRLVARAQDDHPDKRAFLYGHSLGGQIVLNYALRRPAGLGGVIASGPWLRLPFTPPAWKSALGRWLNGLAPALALNNELDRSGLSRDAAVVAAYNADPLVHDRISVRLYNEGTAAAAYALAHAAELRLPVLLLHGGADRLTDPGGTQLFYERAGSADKTFRRYEDWYHEIHNEPGQAEVFKEITDWLGRLA